MDARIILGGNAPDIVGALNNGAIAGQNALAGRQQAQLAQFLQANGSNVLAGDQNALGQMAALGPAGLESALGVQDTRSAIGVRNAAEGRLQESERRSIAEAAAQMSQAEADKVAAEAADNLKTLAVIPDAATWDQAVTAMEMPQLVGQFNKQAEIVGKNNDALRTLLDARVQAEKAAREAARAAEPPDEYGRYAAEETAAGRQPLSRIDYRKAGSPSSSVTVNPDGSTTVVNGIGAMDKATVAAGNRETSTNVITDAASRARELIGVTTTGLIGGASSYNPQSNAAEVYRQVDVLKANAKIENLTAMRAASPTGGALGAVSDKENEMLAAKAGALDPLAGPVRFRQQLDDYELTLLQIIHGPEAGQKIFAETRSAAAGSGSPMSFDDAMGKYGPAAP